MKSAAHGLHGVVPAHLTLAVAYVEREVERALGPESSSASLAREFSEVFAYIERGMALAPLTAVNRAALALERAALCSHCYRRAQLLYMPKICEAAVVVMQKTYAGFRAYKF